MRFDANGSEQMRLNSTGLGVGVTPSAWATYKGLQVGYASLAGYAGSDTLLGSNVYFDGSGFKYIAAGLASSYRQLAGGHQWSTSVAGVNPGDPLTALPLATLSASGDLSLATGNVVMATSGKGIDFSATSEGSGTMTSELLNDYEEGTFTPTVAGTTAAGTGTYTLQSGYYTKVGNLVTAQVYLSWTNLVGATGNLIFSSLPFASSSSANAYGAGSISYVNNIALTASNVLTVLINPGTSFIEAYQYPAGGGATTTVPIDTAGAIIFTITYRV
jgi:hypothetical protein